MTDYRETEDECATYARAVIRATAQPGLIPCTAVREMIEMNKHCHGHSHSLERIRYALGDKRMARIEKYTWNMRDETLAIALLTRDRAAIIREMAAWLPWTGRVSAWFTRVFHQ